MTSDTQTTTPVSTIVALASGRPPAGVGVIRVSGPSARFGFETITQRKADPRRVVYASFRDPRSGEILDRGLAFFLEGPRSFTGEDSAEFQCHGSLAVVEALLDALLALPGFVHAEAGAFTRRAFENGRIDLTAAEGIADLVEAETAAQRRQALGQADGLLSQRAAAWRLGLLQARALAEALIDFADEDDVDPGLVAALGTDVAALAADLGQALKEADRGRRVRDGVTVALLGPPNAGKSSLLNRLSARDVAIVTPVPGTTRDVLEVRLVLQGMAVHLLDTAGLRPSVDPIEQEGIRRARERAASADLVLWLDPEGGDPPADVASGSALVWPVRTKADLHPGEPSATRSVSALDGRGIDDLVADLAMFCGGQGSGEPGIVTNRRQAEAVEQALRSVEAAGTALADLEILAEHLRAASAAIDRLTGRIDVEDVLGAIFGRFCIGK